MIFFIILLLTSFVETVVTVCPPFALSWWGGDACECHPRTTCEPQNKCTQNRFPETCVDCSCIEEASVYDVSSPVTRKYVFGELMEVRWQSTNVATVEIKLYSIRQYGTNPSFAFVANIASNVTSSPFLWNTTLLSTPPKEGVGYSVVVFAPTLSFHYVSSHPFEFVFSSLPESPSCPPGFAPSSFNSTLTCKECNKGFYSVDGRNCTSCGSRTTTLAMGSTSEDACEISTEHGASDYTLHPNVVFDVPTTPIISNTPRTSFSECLRKCTLDALCGSAMFNETCEDTRKGTCVLFFDTFDTTLVGQVKYTTITQSATTGDPLLFSKDNFMSSASAYTSYGFAATNANIQHRLEYTSETACMALCLRDSNCLAVSIGEREGKGECIHYSQSLTTLGVIVKQGEYYSFGNLHLYGRKEDNATSECPSGRVSSTGRSPGCTPCPQHTYAASSTHCNSCPSDRPYTKSQGSVETQCIPALCPSSANGPNYAGQCVCTMDTNCIGSSCNITEDNVHYFNAGDCSDCTCSMFSAAPTIDHILTPMTGSSWYWGDRNAITWVASSGVSFVDIYLAVRHPTLTNTIALSAYIAQKTRNDGVYKWKVPNLLPRTDYAIVIFHHPVNGEATAPTHRNTGFFGIYPKPSECPPGSVNEVTGAPPCVMCDVGFYSASPTLCSRCPQNTTTIVKGSPDADSCEISTSSALGQFKVYPYQWLTTDSFGGYFLESVDHVTLEECAQLCLNDAGCKGFNGGVVGTIQDGDCFLTYSNIAIAGESNLRSIEQLSYFELENAKRVLVNDVFSSHPTCYLNTPPLGGVIFGSPEACAQYCLHESCCLGFQTRSGSDECEILHSSRFSQPENNDPTSSPSGQTAALPSLVCDGALGRTYYEKRISTEFVIQDLIIQPPMLQTVSSQLKVAIGGAIITSLQMNSVIENGELGFLLTLDVRTDSDMNNGVFVVAFVGDAFTRNSLNELIESGSLKIQWPTAIGEMYSCAFSNKHGPCGSGTISQTGYRNFPCHPCPENTFSNTIQTKCITCPNGMISPPRSTSVNDCFLPAVNFPNTHNGTDDDNEINQPASDQSPLHYFNEGDLFSGVFQLHDGDNIASGSLTMEVEKRVASADNVYTKARALLTVFHGSSCREEQGCRTAGKTQYFVTINHLFNNTINIRFVRGSAGWGGITDRSYARRDYVGTVTLHDGTLSIDGIVGANVGVFNMHKLCSFQFDDPVFEVGDNWKGTYMCDHDIAAPSEFPSFDIFKLDVQIQTVTDTAVVVLVDFDHQYGTSQFLARGLLPTGSCSSIRLIPTPNAWQTDQIPGISTFVVHGTLSEDRYVVAGQVTAVPACKCLDEAPPEFSSVTQCSVFGMEDEFCFVSEECPESIPSLEYPGWSYVNIAQEKATCHEFSLTRVCSDHDGECPYGWTFYNNRCYRHSPQPLLLTSAMNTCTSNDSVLVSIHSKDDELFLFNNLIADKFATIPENDTISIWLGLRTLNTSSAVEFFDGRIVSYTNWKIGHPREDQHCAVLTGVFGLNKTVTNTYWESVPCFGNRNGSGNETGLTGETVCMQGIIAANASCACISACSTDDLVDVGGLCKVNAHCNFAFLYNEDWVAPCGEDEIRPVPTLNSSCHQQNSFWFTSPLNGVCERCLQSSDCSANEALVGTCGEFSSPTCQSCGEYCSACFFEEDVNADNRLVRCTACAGDHVLSAITHQCVTTCEEGYHWLERGSNCVPCNVNCQTCANEAALECTSCSHVDGLFLLQPNATCVKSCPRGMFNNLLTQSCEECSSCNATQYQVLPCSTYYDSICADVSECDVGLSELRPPTETSDRVCDTVSCSPGHEIDESGACVPCGAGSTDDDAVVSTKCVSCPKGHFSLVGRFGSCQPCEVGRSFQPEQGQGLCLPVAPVCKKGMYEIKSPTLTSDRLCELCGPTGMTYQNRIDQSFCAGVSTCVLGEFVEASPTLTSDRVCRECPAGSYSLSVNANSCMPCDGITTYQDATGEAHCKPVSACPHGHYELEPPTTTTDRVCAICPVGTFFDSNACLPISSCSEVETEAHPATPFRDVVCVCNHLVSYETAHGNCAAFTVCNPDRQQVEVRAPTPVSDRQCAPGPVALSVCVLEQLDYDMVLDNLSSFINNIEYQFSLRLRADASVAEPIRNGVNMYVVDTYRGSTVVEVAFAPVEGQINSSVIYGARDYFEEQVGSRSLHFFFNNNLYTAVFTTEHSPCYNNTFSVTGFTPNCMPCPSGFAVSRSRTSCIDCRSPSSNAECIGIAVDSSTSKATTGEFSTIAIWVIAAVVIIATVVLVWFFVFVRGKEKVHVIEVPVPASESMNPTFTSSRKVSVVPNTSKNTSHQAWDDEDRGDEEEEERFAYNRHPPRKFVSGARLELEETASIVSYNEEPVMFGDNTGEYHTVEGQQHQLHEEDKQGDKFERGLRNPLLRSYDSVGNTKTHSHNIDTGIDEVHPSTVNQSRPTSQYYNLNESVSSMRTVQVEEVDLRNIKTPAERPKCDLGELPPRTEPVKKRNRLPTRLPAIGFEHDNDGSNDSLSEDTDDDDDCSASNI
eukprot:m.231170 g.231170  ORF g.231170 m.231170 type:complete len:2548 (-) comp13897_c1_seq1:104-7747(-)